VQRTFTYPVKDRLAELREARSALLWSEM
jgi:hypothetical protein